MKRNSKDNGGHTLPDEKIMNENIDYKRLLLCLQKKIACIIGVALAGSILCGAVYLSVRTATMETKYSSESKFYMQFTYDPENPIEQHYIGYTWNDLLHADPIIGLTVAAMREIDGHEAYMPSGDEELKEYLRSEGRLSGGILSDRRLLTVFFSDDSREKTALIQEAVEVGLLAFAAAAYEINTIELILSESPQLVIWDNHLHRAVVFGAVLFLVLAFFVWWLYYILDDSLYSLADIEKRYPYRALGILLKGEDADSPAPFFAETATNLAYIKRGQASPIVALADIPCPDPAALRASGVVLAVPFGRRNGKKTDRCVSFLRAQEIDIHGILITEADETFVGRYYNDKKSRA